MPVRADEASKLEAARRGVDHVIRIDGSGVAGNVERIDDQGRVWVQWLPGASRTALKLDELTTIEHLSSPPGAGGKNPTCAVDLLGGGTILAADVTVRNQQCHVRWNQGDPLVLPVELVAAIRFQPDKKDERVIAALAQPNRDVDRIFVEVAGAVQGVEGLVESLDADELALEWQGKVRKLKRKDVHGVVLAVIGKAPPRDSGVEVSLHGGSTLFGRLKSLVDGKLTLEITPKQQAVIQWNAVAKVAVRSSRLAYLSDLTPVEAVDEPIVTLALPWRRDKSAAGKPLTLGGRTFDKGLGVHARSLLRYDIGGRYDEMAATIGIDAEAQGRGDCEFVVQADGRELYRQRVRGGEPPRELKLKISGAKELTLSVEPGEELDLADHADWANARLLRLSE